MAKIRKNPIIAVAQIRYFDTKEKHNVAKIKKYIAKAAKAKADIILFPETCIHKYNYLKFDDLLIKEICQACKTNKIWTIVTDTFTQNRRHYKISLLIDRQGKIRGRYKKINLCDDEVTPGSKIFTYQTDFAKIGIVICWDLAFPELFAKMKKAGAEIIFIPSYWCYEQPAYAKNHKEKEKQLLKSLLMSRAFENLFFVAYSNPLPGEPDVVSYSAIVGPHRVIKDITTKEGMITSQVNLKEIKKFTKIYPNK